MRIYTVVLTYLYFLLSECCITDSRMKSCEKLWKRIVCISQDQANAWAASKLFARDKRGRLCISRSRVCARNKRSRSKKVPALAGVAALDIHVCFGEVVVSVCGVGHGVTRRGLCLLIAENALGI